MSQKGAQHVLGPGRVQRVAGAQGGGGAVHDVGPVSYTHLKVWRFQLWASYDAWEMENATNAEMIKPLRTGLWFVAA